MEFDEIKILEIPLAVFGGGGISLSPILTPSLNNSIAVNDVADRCMPVMINTGCFAAPGCAFLEFVDVVGGQREGRALCFGSR